MFGVVNAVFEFSDPFAVDVAHHSNCWRDNNVNVFKKSTNLQKVTLTEAQSLFFKQIMLFF